MDENLIGNSSDKEDEIDEVEPENPDENADEILDNDTAVNNNYEKAGQIQNQLGVNALQSMGVKDEKLASMAVKSNGGALSPHNNLANRSLKHKGQDAIANVLDKKDSLMNNRYNPFDKIKNNNTDGLKKNNNVSQNKLESENTGDNSKEKSLSDKVGEKAGSAALQGMGVPKGAADALSPLINKLRKKLNKKAKLKLIVMIVIPVVSVLVIMVPIIASTGGGSDSGGSYSSSEEAASYLYSGGSDEDLYKFLISSGYCSDKTSCAGSDAANFYTKLRDALKNNSNLTKKEADVFIVNMIMYGRSESEAFKAADEIDYIADIIGQSSFSIDSADKYKESFIGENDYFDIYRQDLLEGQTDSASYKENVFKAIVDASKTSSDTAKGNTGSSISGTNYCSGGDVPIESFLSMTTDEYIAAMGPIAQADYTNTGVLASVTLAQSIEESGWGKSGLSQKAKNFFGMKTGAVFETGGWDGVSFVTMRTGEQTKSGSTYYINADFRKYDTVSASIADHSALLVRGRPYRDKVVTKTTYQEQIQAIKDAGYATSVDYVSHIVNIIKKYNLDKWDVILTSSNNTCSSTSAVEGDFSSWKQGDSRWGSITLGNTSTTVHKAGCLVTSVAIQLARSGVSTSLSELNPGTFVEALKSNGGFSGANYVWQSVTRIAPNFVLVSSNSGLSGSQAEKTAQLANLQNSGYYVIIHANSHHWVALDHIDGDTVYINDPGSQSTTLWDKYPASGVISYSAYRVQ